MFNYAGINQAPTPILYTPGVCTEQRKLKNEQVRIDLVTSVAVIFAVSQFNDISGYQRNVLSGTPPVQ